MPDAVAFFAIRLICGMAFMLCAMRRDKVPSPFFRIMLLAILGLAVLFALSSPAALWWGVAIASVAFAGSVFWLLERRQAGTVSLGIVTALSVVALIFCRSDSLFSTSERAGALALASAFASAATLGAAFAGMLLGHRYLTAPGMPLAPLIQLNAFLGIAAILRFLVSAICLFSVFGEFTQSLFWIWLALRWLAGILGPMAVCVMVHRILRYRNTQAATGVLFVGVILTFIGELTADLLQRAFSMPF
jgi:hypothetical protein